MNKKALSESDICDKFIRPAMEQAGWDGMVQIYREFPLRAGRVVVRGRRAKRDASTVLRADYALFFKPNIPLAVVEAKDNSHAMGAGMAQARYVRGRRDLSAALRLGLEERPDRAIRQAEKSNALPKWSRLYYAANDGFRWHPGPRPRATSMTATAA